MIRIHFERGKSFLEYLIMGIQAAKLKRLNLPFREVYSHVSIELDGTVYQTKPSGGFSIKKYQESQNTSNIPERRKTYVIHERFNVDIANRLSSFTFNNQSYPYFKAFWNGVYSLTGRYFGRKKPKKVHCYSFVAKMIGMKDWWKKDAIDIETEIINNMNC